MAGPITFSVKNFTKFQHYRDRTPPWIKLYNELLDDYDFGRLQDASKLHLIMIWLLASRSDNVLPYDPEWVGKRINATEVVNLRVLVDAGFIETNQPLQSLEQSASTTLATCLPRERERDRGEGEREAEAARASAALTDPDPTPSGDLVSFAETACSAAGINPRHAVNFTRVAQAWMSLPHTQEQIIAAIKLRASRPGYKAPRTLQWFSDQIPELVAELHPAKTANQITDEQHVARTHEHADFMVGMYRQDGKWRGAGPAPDQPGCIVDAEILAKHGYTTTSTEAA